MLLRESVFNRKQTRVIPAHFLGQTLVRIVLKRDFPAAAVGGHPRPYVQGHGPSDFPMQRKQTWARELQWSGPRTEVSGFYSRASLAQPRISDDTSPRHGGAAVTTEATSPQTTAALGALASRSPCPLADLRLLVPISCVATALPRTLPCSSSLPPSTHPFKAHQTLLLPHFSSLRNMVGSTRGQGGLEATAEAPNPTNVCRIVSFGETFSLSCVLVMTWTLTHSRR